MHVAQFQAPEERSLEIPTWLQMTYLMKFTNTNRQMCDISYLRASATLPFCVIC